MKKISAIALLLLGCMIAAGGERAPFEVTLTKSRNGVVSTVRIVEVEISSQKSTVELFYTPSRGSADQGDLLLALCLMANGRKESFIRAQTITPMRWEVSFPKSAPADYTEKRMTISMEQCALVPAFKAALAVPPN